jgi:hypothetical protein
VVIQTPSLASFFLTNEIRALRPANGDVIAVIPCWSALVTFQEDLIKCLRQMTGVT